MRILSVFLIAASTIVVSAQSDSLTQDIETIIIKDKRLSLKYSEASRSIDIINREQIDRSPAQSIAELLQNVAGIDVRRRGGHGVQSDLSIRGGTFDQSLILINGVNMSDPQTGHHLMNIPLDLENIERIEILKGPGARRYGQNAYAGAINIVTRNSMENPLTVSSEYSSNTSGKIGVQAFVPTLNARHMFSASKSFSEGYRYNTDYEIDNMYLQSSFELGSNSLMINAGYTNRAFGANGFYASPVFTDQYEEIATSILSATYQVKSNNWKFAPTVYWRRNQDEYIFVRSNPSIYRNLHIGNSYGAEFNASNFNSLGLLGVGVEIRYDDLASNNLGDRSRTTLGFNIEQRFSLLDGNLDITPGVGFYSYNDFGSRAFPGIDAGYTLLDNLKLFGNIGSTWRVPTYTDLYYEDPANLGNPNLEPETALTYELGFKYANRRISIQTSGFVRSSNNLIDWTKDNDDDQWFPSNVGDIEIRGIEINTEWKLNDKASFPTLYANYTFLDGQNRVDASISRYALDIINHQINLGVAYTIGSKWNHSTNFRYIDRLNLDNYSVVDSRLSFKSESLTYGVFVNNLLDTKYTETNLVPMPGRWLGVSLNIGIK